MKKLIFLLAILFFPEFITSLFGQEITESPYAIFGDRTPVLCKSHKHDTRILISITTSEESTLQLFINNDTLFIKKGDDNVLYAEAIDPIMRALFNRPDPKAQHYPDTNPYLYCAANPIRFVDFNGDSISVSEEYQSKFMSDLNAVFGKNAANFQFTSSGNLVYNGDTKSMNRAQKKLLEGLSEIMYDTSNTTVMYEKAYSYIDDKNELKVVSTNQHGGAFTYAPNGLNENTIVVDPDISGKIVVEEITSNYGLETRLPEYGPYVKQKEIQINRADALFHEIGEVLYPDPLQGNKVLNYNNHARKIMKMKPRKEDINHNRYGK